MSEQQHDGSRCLIETRHVAAPNRFWLVETATHHIKTVTSTAVRNSKLIEMHARGEHKNYGEIRKYTISNKELSIRLNNISFGPACWFVFHSILDLVRIQHVI